MVVAVVFPRCSSGFLLVVVVLVVVVALVVVGGGLILRSTFRQICLHGLFASFACFPLASFLSTRTILLHGY